MASEADRPHLLGFVQRKEPFAYPTHDEYGSNATSYIPGRLFRSQRRALPSCGEAPRAPWLVERVCILVCGLGVLGAKRSRFLDPADSRPILSENLIDGLDPGDSQLLE